jgi:SAM-dependent methyltransferase
MMARATEATVDEQAKERGGEVAERWRRLAESADSEYARLAAPAAKVAAMARSAYVAPVLANTAPGGLALEAGCGSGTIALALASVGRRVVGLDISAEVAANLRGNAARLAGETGKPFDVSVVVGDVERMPFADGAFDAVINEGVVEHWLDRGARRAVLAEMGRVVRPGGAVVVWVPNGAHPLVPFWDRTGYPGFAKSRSAPWHKYNWQELADDLAAAGLVDVEADGVSPYSTIAVWPNWRILRALAAVLRRILPEPRWLRRRWGFNLVAVGRVKGSA